MNCSTPGLPVHHQLLESTQTHVHWVVDAIQPSHPPSSSPFSSCLQSFPASESFLMSWLFVSGGQIIGASTSASVLPMNIQGWFPLGWTGLIPAAQGTLKSLLKHHSSKATIFLVLSLLYGPPLTSVHDGRNINNLRYADDTTLMAKSKEELKTGAIWWFLMVLDTVQPFICFSVSWPFLWFKHLPNLKQSQYSPRNVSLALQLSRDFLWFFFFSFVHRPLVYWEGLGLLGHFYKHLFLKVSVFYLWQFLLFNCNLA